MSGNDYWIRQGISFVQQEVRQGPRQYSQWRTATHSDGDVDRARAARAQADIQRYGLTTDQFEQRRGLALAGANSLGVQPVGSGDLASNYRGPGTPTESQMSGYAIAPHPAAPGGYYAAPPPPQNFTAAPQNYAQPYYQDRGNGQPIELLHPRPDTMYYPPEVAQAPEPRQPAPEIRRPQPAPATAPAESALSPAQNAALQVWLDAEPATKATAVAEMIRQRFLPANTPAHDDNPNVPQLTNALSGYLHSNGSFSLNNGTMTAAPYAGTGQTTLAEANDLAQQRYNHAGSDSYAQSGETPPADSAKTSQMSGAKLPGHHGTAHKSPSGPHKDVPPTANDNDSPGKSTVVADFQREVQEYGKHTATDYGKMLTAHGVKKAVDNIAGAGSNTEHVREHVAAELKLPKDASFEDITAAMQKYDQSHPANATIVVTAPRPTPPAAAAGGRANQR